MKAKDLRGALKEAALHVKTVAHAEGLTASQTQRLTVAAAQIEAVFLELGGREGATPSAD